MAITGNVVEDAVWGLQLGWGPYLRDVTATGNVIRRTKIGIAVSVVEGAGPAVISDNLISGAEQGAILGMRWAEVATGELVGWRRDAPAGLSVSGNREAERTTGLHTDRLIRWHTPEPWVISGTFAAGSALEDRVA